MIKVGKKWDKGAIYIGRGSPLGNPFVMSSEIERDHVCDLYEDWLKARIEERDPKVIDALNHIAIKSRKEDVTLGCFCAPKRCHGDTIKRVIEDKLKCGDSRQF
jgi:hypothetical protein